MQFLIFQLGDDRYGLQTRHVVRVLPLLELKAIPRSPGYVAGLMSFRGAPVPVIDLSMLACGTAARPCFDTRIILVDYCADGSRHLLGLVAEQVSDVTSFDSAAFTEPGVAVDDAPYLGKVTTAGGVIVQLVDLAQLLPEQARAILFPPSGPPPAEAPC